MKRVPKPSSHIHLDGSRRAAPTLTPEQSAARDSERQQLLAAFLSDMVPEPASGPVRPTAAWKRGGR